MINFVEVKNYNEFNTLACELFDDTYQTILSSLQREYMLKMFFGVEEIYKNIEDGYKYMYIEDNGFILGFFVYKIYNDHLFLSKLYLKKEAKGLGLASKVFKHLYSIKKPIKLTVNKYNTQAYQVYIHKGFKVIDSVETPIGNGYIMDDYIMILE